MHGNKSHFSDTSQFCSLCLFPTRYVPVVSNVSSVSINLKNIKSLFLKFDNCFTYSLRVLPKSLFIKEKIISANVHASLVLGV